MLISEDLLGSPGVETLESMGAPVDDQLLENLSLKIDRGIGFTASSNLAPNGPLCEARFSANSALFGGIPCGCFESTDVQTGPLPNERRRTMSWESVCMWAAHSTGILLVREMT